jgi:hypothetical protein
LFTRLPPFSLRADEHGQAGDHHERGERADADGDRVADPGGEARRRELGGVTPLGGEEHTERRHRGAQEGQRQRADPRSVFARFVRFAESLAKEHERAEAEHRGDDQGKDQIRQQRQHTAERDGDDTLHGERRAHPGKNRPAAETGGQHQGGDQRLVRQLHGEDQAERADQRHHRGSHELFRPFHCNDKGRIQTVAS